MLKRLLQPHCLIVSLAIMLFIGLLNTIRLNLHYIDPFNNGLKEYEITDIVYAYLSEETPSPEQNIVIINSGMPDRKKIARLVDKLREGEAGAIGLDFYFEDVPGVAEDTLLQTSIKQTPQVVLGSTLMDEDTSDDQLDGVDGVNEFFSAYAATGFGNYPSNETKTVRVYSPGELINGQYIPAFTTAILQKFRPDLARDLLARNHQLEHINYTGHLGSFITQDINTILDTLSAEEVGQLVKGRIALVGYAPSDERANPFVDRHYTPINKSYDNKSSPDMYGIVIHANVLAMILNDNFIRVVPWWLSFLISVLLCYANVVLIRWIYHTFQDVFHGITRALQLVEFVLLFFGIAALFYFFRINLDLAIGILAVLLAYDFIMIYESLVLPRVGWLRRLRGSRLDLPEELVVAEQLGQPATPDPVAPRSEELVVAEGLGQPVIPDPVAPRSEKLVVAERLGQPATPVPVAPRSEEE
jgi:CHASE2 domain-containing sensor protein